MQHNNIVTPLMTDSYKIIMAYTFFKNNQHLDHTAFELFFRKCPFGGSYSIFAGLKEAIAYVQTFKFTKDEINYLRQSIFPPDADEGFFTFLETLDCSQVKVRAMKEGSLCFPDEPVLALEGPQAICQIIETPLINLISFATLVATNASRMRTLTGPKARLIEFGLRRAQGPDGAFSATQYSFVGGFDGTSNVVAGYKLGIPVYGTIAHSFVTSFSSLDDAPDQLLNGVSIKQKALEYRAKLGLSTNDGELASFISFATFMYNNFMVLVDTYNTMLSGVPNFVCVAFALQDAGYEPKGIRLDSGDLADLSKQAKRFFRKAGQEIGRSVDKFVVTASNDINEEALLRFNEQGHEIDVFGIGTNLVTCQKQPALGLVYKLVECKNQPTMKLSEEADKTTLPGQKQIYRLWLKDSIVDLIAGLNEKLGEEIVTVDRKNPLNRYLLKPQRVEVLLEEVWDGQQSKGLLDLQEAKQQAAEQLKQFPENVTRITKPSPYKVYLTEKYYLFFRERMEQLATVIKIQ